MTALSTKSAPGEPGERIFARGPRRALGIGGALLAFGLSLVAIGPSDVGMVITLGGLLLLIYGVHAFGRLGPDEPIDRTDADRSRTKRVKRGRRKARAPVTSDGEP